MLLINLLLILTLKLVEINSTKIACQDENGQKVDWFSVYKLPRYVSNSNQFIQNGTAYTHLSELSQKWSLGLKSMNDSQSNAGRTLNILYNNETNSEIGYMMYNDQYGSDDDEEVLANTRKAHAKGVLIFDDQTAVWLIHSIPNYPPKPNTGKYKISPSQTVYGQSMLCITVKLSELDKIGKQLLYSYPQVFDSYIPNSLLSQNNKTGHLNNLVSVIKGERVKVAPWFNVQQLTTLNNNKFLAFHKDTKFDQDLYANLIGPTLQSSLFTETWSRGIGTLPTNCNTTYPVYNIEKINMNKLIPNFSFTVYSDHSKWAANLAMETNETKYVCIGDINRQNSQKKRGGGSVCFVGNQNVWNAYFSLIELTENCVNQNVAPANL